MDGRYAVLTPKAVQHDTDLLLGRILLAGCSPNVFDNPLGRRLLVHGFLSHLHSLTVTMSQKSSFLQPANSVSQVLIPDKRLGKEKATFDQQKVAVRAELEEHSTKVMKPYEGRINQLLDNFNAGFSIAQTKPAYGGGVASSTYQLVINNTGVNLGDGKTPIDQPSFKNTPSAGDRSTLALAVFITHLERDPDRAKRMVVFDDPFTSQDAFRRRQTVHEIVRAGDGSKQLIVFSHDATFLRQIRDKCKAGQSLALQLGDHRSLGIKIMPCDLDDACRGRAASDMDDLQAYVTSGVGTDRDIIRKMRIVLETHCRSTYPGSFASDDRLGGMVEKIRKAGDRHPAAALMDELDQIIQPRSPSRLSSAGRQLRYH